MARNYAKRKGEHTRRRCRWCGIYKHIDEVIRIPSVLLARPGKGYRKGLPFTLCCLRCLEKINERIRAIRIELLNYESAGDAESGDTATK